MGKTPSPGKWFKTLLGKKSSKSNLAKGNERLKLTKKEDPVISSSMKDEITNIPFEPPVVSEPIQTVVNPSTIMAEKQPSDSSTKDNENGESNSEIGSQNDSNELKLEQAVMKIQAAFRAHQAHKEFQTLKGIIRLQAIIRGRLVRRQAVVTYSCIWGIVKLQSLVRGQKARSLYNGIQLQKRVTEAVNSEKFQASSYSWMENPEKLCIVDKLLALSPIVIPLKLQYDPEDVNSAKAWLERWTRLQIWSPNSRATKNLNLKPLTKNGNSQTIETEKRRLKENISSIRSIAENEKTKRNVKRKASSVNKESPRIENGKSKQSSRKTTSLKKVSNTPLSNGSEKTTRKSTEKKKYTTVPEQNEVYGKTSAFLSDVLDNKNDIRNELSEDYVVNKDRKSIVPEKREEEELNDKTDADKQLCSENGKIASEKGKESDRRASLPAKIDNQDDGLTQSTRKLPSYMAQTESARARLKGQGSPRFALERTEKNGTGRRHSLPSVNGKLSTMTPRAHRLLLATSKGSMNSDRSISSSKDAVDKLIRAEWKR